MLKLTYITNKCAAVRDRVNTCTATYCGSMPATANVLDKPKGHGSVPRTLIRPLCLLNMALSSILMAAHVEGSWPKFLFLNMAGIHFETRIVI